jgi:hypothetical protein
VPQNQLLKVAKLRDAEIRSETCLHSLFSNYPYTDISFLNHRDVVATITNTGDSLTSLDADVLSN